TSDLRPLEPRYVSTVDSGNLAGHLIALANACREFVTQPIVHAAWRRGIGDALDLLRDQLGALDEHSTGGGGAARNTALDEFAGALDTSAASLDEVAAL